MTDAQPLPAQPLPPDPMTSAKNAMAEAAKNEAQDMVMRRVRSGLKAKLPRVLHPLIPGERGTVAGAVKKDIKKRIAAAIGGLIFSVVFFGIVGLVLLFCVAVVGLALLGVL